jgi:pimeloyl-ACP methyl ester carboxylesterase
MSDQTKGHAAGVPYVAVPPAGGARAPAPLVLAWHLLDSPRTESAFAAALPLDGLDAWRIYLGLPHSGERLPDGGLDALMQRGYEDAVLRLYTPIAFGAVDEAGPAIAALREELGLDEGPVGVMGGSLGAAVAQLVMAESDLDVRAAVLVNPVTQLRRVVQIMERQFEFEYTWSDEASAAVDRVDFVARADELSAPVLFVLGEEDDPGFHESARAVAAALGDRAELVTVPGMGHGLADEPGMEPAPQTPHAAAVDRHAVAWFERHLNRA